MQAFSCPVSYGYLYLRMFYIKINEGIVHAHFHFRRKLCISYFTQKCECSAQYNLQGSSWPLISAIQSMYSIHLYWDGRQTYSLSYSQLYSFVCNKGKDVQLYIYLILFLPLCCDMTNIQLFCICEINFPGAAQESDHSNGNSYQAACSQLLVESMLCEHKFTRFSGSQPQSLGTCLNKCNY